MWRPPSRVLKPANGADAAIFAQREPMLCSTRYAEHVAGAYFHRGNPPVQSEKKDAASGEDEPHLVLVVRMLLIEPGQHGFKIWRRRVHVNDVRRDVPTAPFHLVNLVGISNKHLVGARISRHPVKTPTLVIDAKLRQRFANLGFRVDLGVFCGETKNSHTKLLNDLTLRVRRKSQPGDIVCNSEVKRIRHHNCSTWNNFWSWNILGTAKISL